MGLKTYICIDEGDPVEIKENPDHNVLMGNRPLIVDNKRYEVLDVFEERDERLNCIVAWQLHVTPLEDTTAPVNQNYKFY
ncbi:MAG: hypothetical protein ACR2PH_09660 [Desulfobulbia bacterium]